jgi:hypothetical protein
MEALALLVMMMMMMMMILSRADSAMATASGAAGNGNGNGEDDGMEENQRIVGRSLEAARDFLLSAMKLQPPNASDDAAHALFRSSLRSVDQAAAHVAALHWDHAKLSVSESLASMSDCFRRLTNDSHIAEVEHNMLSADE